jgi:hypothetical protein
VRMKLISPTMRARPTPSLRSSLSNSLSYINARSTLPEYVDTSSVASEQSVNNSLPNTG